MIREEDIGARNKRLGDFDIDAYNHYLGILHEREIEETKRIEAGTGGDNSSITVSVEEIKQTPRLSEAIEKFITNNQEGPKPWGRNELDKYRSFLQFFCDQMEDCYLHELTTDKIRQNYVNVIPKYPANVTRYAFFKDSKGNLLSTDKIIQIAKEHSVSVCSVRTLKQKAGHVQNFLNYYIKEELLEPKLLHPFDAITELKTIKKKRPIFNDKHLELLFSRQEFKTGKWFTKEMDFRFWGPLIALYTGARVNEICQLDVGDVITDAETGVVYFNLVDEDEGEDGNVKSGRKTLKTEAARRKVPVHDNLIKLGILDYVESRRKKKEKKLIGGVTYTSSDRWSKKLKTWFNHTLFDDVGLNKHVSEKHTTLSFHCFRSTVINFSKQNRLDRRIMLELVGHDEDLELTVHDDYTDVYNLKLKQQEINKLNFNLDIDSFFRWR
jgi:integrase